MLLAFCVLKFILLWAFISNKAIWFKLPIIKINAVNFFNLSKSYWVPLFKKKSYFFYFLTFNNFQKYWYVMINLIYYYIYIKPLTSNLFKNAIFTTTSKKKKLVIQYKFVLYLVSLNKKKKIIFCSYYFISKLFNHTKYFLFCNFSEIWYYLKSFFLSYVNYWFFLSYLLKKGTVRKIQTNSLVLYLRRDQFFKKYFFLVIFTFLKKVKNIFFKKKNYFLKKYFLFLVIFYLKQLIKKKIFFFLTRYSLLIKFLQKKLALFLRLNKKYFMTLNRFFLYTFFYLYFYILLYKNINITNNLWKYLLTFNIWKKHRTIYYFLRYNILYVFQHIYKQFNIYGFKLIIRGKYSTFAGGRKKKFSSFYQNFSFSNFSYFIKYLSTTTFSKLGSAEFKVFLIYK